MTKSRLWTGFIWVSALVIALASWRFAVAPVGQSMPHLSHYLSGLSLPLFMHIVPAPLALAIAPFQLSTRLRRARPMLHRAMGYLYAVSILVAGGGALLMMPGFQGTPFAAACFVLLAVLWLGFTALAIWKARQGNYAAHRRWMLRSITLTFAAVALRLMMPFLMLGGMSVAETYSITAWASWVPSLIVLEWWLRR